MISTTSSSVTVNVTLPAGKVTSYVDTQVAAFITYNGVTTRTPVTTGAGNVVNSDALTAGSITVSISVPSDGVYKVEIMEESVANVDTAGTSFTPIAIGSVRKFTNTTSLDLTGK